MPKQVHAEDGILRARCSQRLIREYGNELEQLILLRIDEVLAEASPGPAPVIELTDVPGAPWPILAIQA